MNLRKKKASKVIVFALLKHLQQIKAIAVQTQQIRADQKHITDENRLIKVLAKLKIKAEGKASKYRAESKITTRIQREVKSDSSTKPNSTKAKA